MKRTILLVLALLLALSATGCFAVAGPPKAVQTEYDEQGRVIKEGVPERQGGFYTYEYDENGFLNKRSEYLTEDQPTPYCVTVYYYDGIQLSHSVGSYSDGNTENTYYHPNGQRQKSTMLDANNKVIGVEEYNEQGETIRMDLYHNGVIDKSQHYDPAHKGDDRHLIGYDIYDKGKLSVSHKTTYNEDGTSRNETYTRDYETGKMYLSRLIVTKDGVSVEEQYDVDGNMIYSGTVDDEYTVSIGGNTSFGDNITVEYDEDGNMVFGIKTEDK